ncbi:MAG: hypothetical protein QM722_05255 [Piscinibacter sp.]
MNETDRAAILEMWATELEGEVETLAALLENLLPSVYETEAEIGSSPEAMALGQARELLSWMRGGPSPSWLPVN